jgi:hypothetical protein
MHTPGPIHRVSEQNSVSHRPVRLSSSPSSTSHDFPVQSATGPAKEPKKAKNRPIKCDWTNIALLPFHERKSGISSGNEALSRQPKTRGAFDKLPKRNLCYGKPGLFMHDKNVPSSASAGDICDMRDMSSSLSGSSESKDTWQKESNAAGEPSTMNPTHENDVFSGNKDIYSKSNFLEGNRTRQRDDELISARHAGTKNHANLDICEDLFETSRHGNNLDNEVNQWGNESTCGLPGACSVQKPGDCLIPESPDGRSCLSAAETAYTCGDSAKAVSPADEHCWAERGDSLVPQDSAVAESSEDLKLEVSNIHEEMLKHPHEARIVQGVRGQFQIVRKLGTGGFATVYKAWNASESKFVALKVFSPCQDSLTQCMTEANYLRRYGDAHSNVIHLVNCPPAAPSNHAQLPASCYSRMS